MRAVCITGKGGPAVLPVIDRPVREPGPGEVRIVGASAAVGLTDIGLRQMGGELAVMSAAVVDDVLLKSLMERHCRCFVAPAHKAC